MGIRAIVIGGGVIGLSIARKMSMQGIRNITVIDRGKMGHEASWAAAGMLAPNAETDTIDDFYRFCSESNLLYPGFSKELLDETGIDIEYNCSGTLELAFDPEKAEELGRKFARQQAANIEVRSLQPAELLAREPNISSEVVSGLFYPNDGQVNNRKLVTALETFARTNGIDLIQDSEVTELLIEDQRITGIQLHDRRLYSDLTILTTGAWTSHIKFAGEPAPFEVKPIRGQMLAIEALPGMIKTVVYGAGAYLLQRSDGRVLVGATVEDVGFDRNVSEKAIDELRRSAIATVPELGKFEVVETWCGFRPFAADGFPVIGEVPGLKGLVVATAHYRNGILLAPLTANIVTSLITGTTRSDFLKPFSPARFSAVNTAAGER